MSSSVKDLEKKFRLIMDNSNDLIAILNQNFEHEFINEKAYLNILGYSSENIIGKRPRDFIHPDDITRSTKSIRKGYFDKEISDEYRIRHKDGHYIWVQVRGSFLKDDGQVSGAIFITRDITERKKSEQKLKESEEKYSNLFQYSNDAIILHGLDGNILDVNQKVSDLFGYTKSELLKLKIPQLHPSKTQEKSKTAFKEIREKDYIRLEIEFKKKNGELFPADLSSKVINIRGDLIIQGVIRDITESKKTENELMEVSRLKSEFLRRASHELKTPLISIKGFSDLILALHEDQLEDSIISKIKEINDGCVRLQNIINNLLKTSRLESTDLKPKIQEEDLSFLIKFCVHELESLAERRNQSINLNIHSDLYANIEKEEIYDVLSNLLTNAIKYTPPRGKIEIKTELKKDAVVVSVKDNGIGFTKDQKTKIFKQFGKIERYGQGLDLGIDGTGLGLYISKRIVEAHGGKIWMASEGKNKGSTFYFSIPKFEKNKGILQI